MARVPQSPQAAQTGEIKIALLAPSQAMQSNQCRTEESEERQIGTTNSMAVMHGLGGGRPSCTAVVRIKMEGRLSLRSYVEKESALCSCPLRRSPAATSLGSLPLCSEASPGQKPPTCLRRARDAGNNSPARAGIGRHF